MTKNLWSAKPLERLHSARQVTAAELRHLHESLCSGCPIEPWPFGNATVVNPFLVTLGASPGNSPAAGDADFLSAGGHLFPTCGEPHPGTRYRDTRGFWDKLRVLVRTALMAPDACEDDGLSLFGNLNLDTGMSGEAKTVSVKSEFAEWLLRTIRHKLRPRIVVMLGLTTYLRGNSDVAGILREVFPGFELNRPHREIPFYAYEKKRLLFREWDVGDDKSGNLTLVMWPQHPSKAPFSNGEYWAASCREFAERYRLTLLDH